MTRTLTDINDEETPDIWLLSTLYVLDSGRYWSQTFHKLPMICFILIVTPKTRTLEEFSHNIWIVNASYYFYQALMWEYFVNSGF